MATVTISIGRNIGNYPMYREAWLRFQEEVVLLLEKAEAEVFVKAAQSSGLWQGVTEESSTFVAAVPDEAVGALTAHLGALAIIHRQDAIAVTVGETILV